ncbi:MAG: hypothetical protein AMJ81_04595 [Phycisphaerae bacterium SM23_33]|nr:MAG: hypothetical protein AMJ81_04595 [Phycisphaerae bacterium SM23_33]
MNEDRKNRLNRLTAKLFRKKEPPPSLEAEQDGFSYVRREERTTVHWSDVKEVFAFKRDIFAVDLICIGFRVSDDGRYWEIDEQMSGYEDVLAAATEAFPGLDPDWWHKVAFPAFKTNLVTLWGRKKTPAIWQSE